MKAQPGSKEEGFRTALYVCQHGKPYYHHYNGSGLARYGYRLGQLAVEHAAVGSGDDDKAWATIVLTKSHSFSWELTHGSAKPGDWLLIWQYFKYFHKQADQPDQGLIIEVCYSSRSGDELHKTRLLNKTQALRVAATFSTNHWGQVTRVVDCNTGEVLGEYQYGQARSEREIPEHYPQLVVVSDFPGHVCWMHQTNQSEAVLYMNGIPVGVLTSKAHASVCGRWIWDAKCVLTCKDLATRVDPWWQWSRTTPRNYAHAKFTRLVQEVAGGSHEASR